MIIAGLDFETTGLDPEKDQITEVGAILWDTEMNIPVGYFNRLLQIEGNVPAEIVKLTGITDEMLSKYGDRLNEAQWDFIDFVDNAEMFLAHNAPFDRSFMKSFIGSDGHRPWIDSCVDVDYPETIQTRKLTHLAAEHGFVNPFAHRAMTDVLTMFQVVSKYDWNQTIKNAQTPNVVMQAMVTFSNNHKAKGCGYRWDATKKVWIKQVKEHRVNEEIVKCNALGFLSKRVG